MLYEIHRIGGTYFTSIRCSVRQLISPFLSRAPSSPPIQLYALCPRPHLIRCIPSTRTPSTMPYPFAVFYTPYFIFIPSTIYQTQYFQRHLHFNSSSTANKNVFSLDSARA